MQESKFLAKQEMLDRIDETDATDEASCAIETQLPFGDPAELEKLEEVIRDYIRPGVEEHGGMIELHGYHDGVVYVKMGGACEGCESISATLEQGVQAILRLCVPGVEKVELIKETTEAKDKKTCC